MSNDSPGRGSAVLSLDACLVTWGRWERGYRGGPQPIKVATWASTGGTSARTEGTDRKDDSATSHLTRSDAWIAQHVSKSIEALPQRDHQLVLEIEYIWNGSLHRVFRNNRLPRDRGALDRLLVEAKEALEPILRRRIGVRLA